MHLVIPNESLCTLDGYNARILLTCLTECEIHGGLVSDHGDLMIEVKPERKAQVVTLLAEFRLEWVEVVIRLLGNPDPTLN